MGMKMPQTFFLCFFLLLGLALFISAFSFFFVMTWDSQVSYQNQRLGVWIRYGQVSTERWLPVDM